MERVADRALESVLQDVSPLRRDAGERPLIPLAVITLLILANALFVAAEFAIVGASRAQIEHDASDGSRLAQRVARILQSPTQQDRFIATTQIGSSVASLGLGMYGENVLAGWIEPRLMAYDQYRGSRRTPWPAWWRWRS